MPCQHDRGWILNGFPACSALLCCAEIHGCDFGRALALPPHSLNNKAADGCRQRMYLPLTQAQATCRPLTRSSTPWPCISYRVYSLAAGMSSSRRCYRMLSTGNNIYHSDRCMHRCRLMSMALLWSRWSLGSSWPATTSASRPWWPCVPPPALQACQSC